MMRGILVLMVVGFIFSGLRGGLRERPRAAHVQQPMVVTVVDTPVAEQVAESPAAPEATAAPQPEPPTEPAPVSQPGPVIVEAPADLPAEPAAVPPAPEVDDEPAAAIATTSAAGCQCDCAEQIKSLEDRVAALEARCKCGLPQTAAAAVPVAPTAPPAAPLAPVASQPRWQKTIVMLTESWCKPCQDWKRIEQPLVEQDGYTVTMQASGGGPVPRFRVQVGHLFRDHTGYLTRAQLRQIEQELTRQLNGGR